MDFLSILMEDMIYPRIRFIVDGLLIVTDRIAGYKEGDSGPTQVDQASRKSTGHYEVDYASAYSNYNTNISNYYTTLYTANLQLGQKPGDISANWHPWGGDWTPNSEYLDSDSEEMLETRMVAVKRTGKKEMHVSGAKEEKKVKRTLRSRVSSAFRRMFICGPKKRGVKHAE